MADPRLALDFTKQVGSFRLEIEVTIGNEILVLFGPSGAGKTQTLYAIAGLTRPDQGEITLDGRSLFRRRGGEAPVDLPARQRQIAMVFQQYALFPHLTARENVEFPMRPASKARALELLGRVRLEDHADRYPHQLSGGQQQRVAIARALAANARVLLLDEPFSALDRPVRDALHQDLRTLQEETGIVIVYVTHNLEDALVTGDRLALLDHGRIIQAAPAGTIFSAPRSRSVLEILGVPNLLDGQLIDGKLDWNGLSIQLPPTGSLTASPTASWRGREGMALSGYLPSEEVLLSDDQRSDRLPNLFPCRVRRVLPVGRSHRVIVDLPNGGSIEALLRSPSAPPRIGTSLYVSLPPHAIVLTAE